MSDIIFKLKKPIDPEVQSEILKEITIGNEEGRKQWKKTAKAFNGRMIRYTVGWTDFSKFIALPAS